MMIPRKYSISGKRSIKLRWVLDKLTEKMNIITYCYTVQYKQDGSNPQEDKVKGWFIHLRKDCENDSYRHYNGVQQDTNNTKNLVTSLYFSVIPHNVVILQIESSAFLQNSTDTWHSIHPPASVLFRDQYSIYFEGNNPNESFSHRCNAENATFIMTPKSTLRNGAYLDIVVQLIEIRLRNYLYNDISVPMTEFQTVCYPTTITVFMKQCQGFSLFFNLFQI